MEGLCRLRAVLAARYRAIPIQSTITLSRVATDIILGAKLCMPCSCATQRVGVTAVGDQAGSPEYLCLRLCVQGQRAIALRLDLTCKPARTLAVLLPRAVCTSDLRQQRLLPQDQDQSADRPPPEEGILQRMDLQRRAVVRARRTLNLLSPWRKEATSDCHSWVPAPDPLASRVYRTRRRPPSLDTSTTQAHPGQVQAGEQGH